MPQGSIHVSRPLTEVSVRYNNEEYIAGKVLKDIPVQKESDQYYVYDNDFRIEETSRANGSPSNRVTWEVSTSTYSLREHAVSDIITTRDRANADSPIQLDADTTEYLTDKIMMRCEKDAADLLFTTTTFSNNATLNTATSWIDNTTTSAPIQNVLSATTKIISNGGGRANLVMVIGQGGFDALKENAQVYNRIQYVERAILTADLLASVFDLKEVYVGSAYYNNGKEGATVSMTAIWGTDALVANIDPRPRLKTKTAAATLRLSQKGKPYKVRKWYDEEREGDVIEVQTMYQHRAIATSSAYLFKTVTVT